MVTLETIQPVLQPMITLLAETLKVDAAIIDHNYKLVAFTDSYVQHKGTEVHIPSINSVFDQGGIVFSRPGRMQTCRGCRFQDNCPATLEILDSIMVGKNPVGIISLSMFQAPHKKMTRQNTRDVERRLHRVCRLIAEIVKQIAKGHDARMWRKMLSTAVKLTPDPTICLDMRGNILEHNLAAEILFGHEGLSQHSIYDLLPACEFNGLLSGKKLDRRAMIVGTSPCRVMGSPVRLDNRQCAGAVLNIVSPARTARKPQRPLTGDDNALDRLIGESPAMVALKSTIRKIAGSRSTVVITGETGTGKEMVARAIHEYSDRKNNPFVAVNCAAIPEHLLESELFGYVKGAFTGAVGQGKAGLFEMADTGTLFLDEIGEMPTNLQIKLLRSIQDRAVRRLGSNRIIPLNLRIIAATHQDLADSVRNGRFRQDLFYRLNVIPVHIPPLRERPSDLPLLASHFLSRFNHQLNCHLNGFTQKAMDRITAHEWPGNVRELENAVEYAVNLEESRMIRDVSLPGSLHCSDRKSKTGLGCEVAHLEKRAIESTLQTFGRHLEGKRKAAAHMGMSLRTLYRKMEKYGISL